MSILFSLLTEQCFLLLYVLHLTFAFVIYLFQYRYICVIAKACSVAGLRSLKGMTAKYSKMSPATACISRRFDSMRLPYWQN